MGSIFSPAAPQQQQETLDPIKAAEVEAQKLKKRLTLVSGKGKGNVGNSATNKQKLGGGDSGNASPGGSSTGDAPGDGGTGSTV